MRACRLRSVGNIRGAIRPGDSERAADSAQSTEQCLQVHEGGRGQATGAQDGTVLDVFGVYVVLVRWPDHVSYEHRNDLHDHFADTPTKGN
jgi:hypothetical protein